MRRITVKLEAGDVDGLSELFGKVQELEGIRVEFETVPPNEMYTVDFPIVRVEDGEAWTVFGRAAVETLKELANGHSSVR